MLLKTYVWPSYTESYQFPIWTHAYTSQPPPSSPSALYDHASHPYLERAWQYLRLGKSTLRLDSRTFRLSGFGSSKPRPGIWVWWDLRKLVLHPLRVGLRVGFWLFWGLRCPFWVRRIGRRYAIWRMCHRIGGWVAAGWIWVYRMDELVLLVSSIYKDFLMQEVWVFSWE